MFNFPEVSMIRFPKLILHSMLLMVLLTLMSLFSADIVGGILGKPVEVSKGFVSLLGSIWLFFALQSKKYKKQKTNNRIMCNDKLFLNRFI
ncbi:hypothetical protein JNUCC1_02823 [Lentibacillus sp. JNUCC-1]|nr:hypothetical protein [Lentibacillus sp. JNUCC-1]